MDIKLFDINNTPSVLYTCGAEKLCLFVHGKCGNKEEAKALADIIGPNGFDVLAFDLPGHGQRVNSGEELFPWIAVPEMQEVYSYARQRYKEIYLHATSIGAYFSLIAFPNKYFQKALFISPVVDMQQLIENMMKRSGVSSEKLESEGEIAVDFGEKLSWKYYCYAKSHPISEWNSRTSILYAGHDNLTDKKTVTDFSKTIGALLQIYEDGEHWFHTENQLSVWRDFIKREFIQ